MKCPGCEIEKDDYRELQDEVWHMERCHPEIIMARWREHLYPDEIKKLKADMESRLPKWEALCKYCTEQGWEVVFTAKKDLNLIVLEANGQQITTKGITPVAALCLAIDIVNYRNGNK